MEYNFEYLNVSFNDYCVIDKASIHIDLIIDITCEHLRVNKADVLTKKRNKDLVRARWYCYKLIREIKKETLSDIGFVFYVDHSTVHYGLEKLNQEISIYPEIEVDYNNLLLKIKKHQYNG